MITSGRSMEWETKNVSRWIFFEIGKKIRKVRKRPFFSLKSDFSSWGKGRKMTFSQNPLNSRFWASGFWMSILSSANFKKDPPWYIFSLSVHAPATSETKKNNRTKEKINTDSPSHLMLHSRGQSIDADFLQPSEQLVQGLSKGGQGLPDIQMSLSPMKRSTMHASRTIGNTCSREKHSSIWLQSPGNSPATAGLRLLHQAALDLLSLLLEPGFGCKFHMSYMLFDCICTGCLLLQPSMTWCKVEKGQTSPSRSSTFSVSPSVAVVLGWKEACVYKDTFVC